MNRLAHFRERQATRRDQLDPALERAEVPRGGVGEVVAEPGPRPGAPAILIWLVAAGDDRVKRLDDDCTTGSKKFGRRLDERVDGFLADEREVRDGDIDGDLQLTARDRLVGCDAELTFAGRSRLVDECRHDIDTDDSLNALCAERADEPPLAASEVEHGFGV